MSREVAKKGLIYQPPFDGSWRDNSALQPTAFVMKDRIRIYICFRDVAGTGRISFVDVDMNDPSKILDISKQPILDIGQNGMFDDNGVAPTAIIEHNDKLLLYYAGYQNPKKVRFVAFGGLAVSFDRGETFQKFRTVPVFERSDEGALFRVPHSVMFDEGKFKFWYGAGGKFILRNDKTLPVYNIWYLETDNLTNIPLRGKEILYTNSDEHRLGRPNVLKDNKQFKMFYGFGSGKKPYQLGYAESNDGEIGARQDSKLGLHLSNRLGFRDDGVSVCNQSR